jgi:flavin reductase (DIM6/NTAB) family NADH-FMN oxidoreductase RutF
MTDPETRKTVLRMIPYGLFILTSQDKSEQVAAAAVNWVTQTSFKPPLVSVAVRGDSFVHQVIQESGVFALNALGKGQGATAFAFFKPTVREGMILSGEPFHFGETGSPLIDSAVGYIECRVAGSLAVGDHTIFAGEVVAAGLNQAVSGRPDEAILLLKDLGGNIFYGG